MRPRYTKTRKTALAAGYRSGLEKGIADDLTKRGISFEFEPTKFPYLRTVRGGSCSTCLGKAVVKRGFYTPDFHVSPGTPDAFWVEAKGRFTGADRTKLLAVRESWPELRLRILFAADNWCTKAHKQRYSTWAERNGFVFAVGRILPREWIS